MLFGLQWLLEETFSARAALLCQYVEFFIKHIGRGEPFLLKYCIVTEPA
jgi:hypothetical protein